MKVIRCDVCGCEIESFKDVFMLSIYHVEQRENIVKLDLCRNCAEKLYGMIEAEAKEAEE